jgi:hypothetical protein
MRRELRKVLRRELRSVSGTVLRCCVYRPEASTELTIRLQPVFSVMLFRFLHTQWIKKVREKERAEMRRRE